LGWGIEVFWKVGEGKRVGEVEGARGDEKDGGEEGEDEFIVRGNFEGVGVVEWGEVDFV